MRGTILAKALKRHAGPVYVGMLTLHDVPYVRVVKSDLINWALTQGTDDTGLESRYDQDGMWLTNKTETSAP